MPDAAPRLDRLVEPALLVAAVAALIAWRQGLGLFGALGTDAALWGLTARDLAVGAAPLVPPGWPGLLALIHGLGVALIPAGVAISVAAAAGVGVAAWRVCRRLGAGPVASGLAGVGAVALPDLVGWSQQLQPDSLTALLVVTLGGLLAGAAGGSSRAAWGAAVVGGLLPLVREHGVPLAALTALSLWVLGPGRRWPRALLLVAMVWLSPLLVGVAPGTHPLDVPWGDRAGGALAAFSATHPDELPFLRELHREPRRAYLELVAQGDRLGQLRWHAARSARLAADGWAWIALGGVSLGAAARRRRSLLALGLPLLAALPALLIWSQRRHVLLVVPLALVCAAVGAAHLGRVGRAAILVVGLALAAGWPARWATLARGQQTERLRAEHFAEIGAYLAQHAPAHSLLGGLFQDVGLYHPLPRHDPDGTAADWSTWLVSDRPPPRSPLGTWARVHQIGAEPTQGPGLSVFRLEPDRSPRPCAGIAPAPGTAFLAVERAHATLPGCPEGIAPR